MQEIIRESAINMSTKANVLYSLTTEMTPKIDKKGVGFSLRSRDYKDPQCVCIEGNGQRESHKGDGYRESEVMYTLNTVEQHAVFRKQGHPQNAEQGQGWEKTTRSDTLNVFDNSENRTPTLVVENHPNDSRVKIREDGKVQSLTGRMGTGGGNVPMLKEQAVVRRLTPLECERLQGYPDGWTDIGEWVDSKGKKHKDADSPRYKALGNSIALPFWGWMAERMVKCLKADGVEDPTMASLFDGIGGFPLSFSRAGCEPIWASEIEEFPIAVTKIRFPEE